MVFTRFSGHTDSLSHSQTDKPDYRMPPAPFFNGDVGIKAKKMYGTGSWIRKQCKRMLDCKVTNMYMAYIHGHTIHECIETSDMSAVYSASPAQVASKNKALFNSNICVCQSKQFSQHCTIQARYTMHSDIFRSCNLALPVHIITTVGGWQL